METCRLTDPEEIAKSLAEPFDPSEVRFKPAVVSGNRALALAYITARAVMDRLDDSLGLGNWQTEYRDAPHGVICRLSVRINGEWIVHEDFGSLSEQNDEGDKLKAGFSDALKRVAVHVKVGRYLYDLPSTWADYDPQKKQFARTPTLPEWAIPKPKKVEPIPKKDEPVLVPLANRPEHALPANGQELQKRLYDYDTKLTKQGLCHQGDLVKYVVEQGVKAGYGEDITKWTIQGISLAVEEVKIFELRQRSPTKDKYLPGLQMAAKRGNDVFEKAWGALSAEVKDVLQPSLEGLRDTAEKATVAQKVRT